MARRNRHKQRVLSPTLLNKTGNLTEPHYTKMHATAQTTTRAAASPVLRAEFGMDEENPEKHLPLTQDLEDEEDAPDEDVRLALN